MSTEMIEDEPPFVAETLDWCNGIREEKGLEPLDRLPNGLPDDPMSCPCGEATGLYVDYTTYGPNKKESKDHPLPFFVTDFVRAFDSCELPQYLNSDLGERTRRGDED